MISNSHHSIDAFIEEHEYDWTADGELCQLITVMMVDELEQLDPAVCAITPARAPQLRVPAAGRRRTRRTTDPGG